VYKFSYIFLIKCYYLCFFTIFALMKRRYCGIVIFGFLLANLTAKGQDVVFNHPYSGMLYTNPAYTGIFGAVHAGLSYRNQFTTSPSPYHTYYAEIDAFINKWNCAFGAYILNTTAAGSRLIETKVGLSYMFNVKINEDLEFKPALQIIFQNKQRNFQSYTFPDRIDITGVITPLGPQDYEPYNVNNVDFAVGAILQYRQLEFGLSAHHFKTQQADDKLITPFKFIVHAKYIFNLSPHNTSAGYVNATNNWDSFNEIKLIPYFRFTHQENYQYITGGLFLQSGALFVGGGIKTALKQEITNIALSGGFAASGIRIGYSMDFIALGNKLKGWSGMSHEVFLHLSFGERVVGGRPKWKKYSSCGCYL